MRPLDEANDGNVFPSALRHSIFTRLNEVATEKSMQLFVIGGYVRDFLLGKACKDIDIVVIGSGIEAANAFAQKIGKEDALAVYPNFGTALVMYEDYAIEFVGARKESYRSNSRKPLVENGSLADDQARRDLTINALSISLNTANYGQLLDPFGGIDDLKNGIIRTPLEPDITFSDDPLRMLRAIRFATTLNFEIEKNTLNAITKNKERINIISAERIAEELNKMLLAPKPSIGFKHLFNTGLLKIIFPEMQALYGVEERNGLRHKDNFYHTLKVLDNLCQLSDDLWLRWSAVLHDIAKPHTKRFDPKIGWTFHGHEDKGARMVPKIFARFRLPMNEKMRFVQKMVALHLRPIALVDDEVTDSAIRRLIVDAGDDLEALMKLCRADITTRDNLKLSRYLENFDIVEQKIAEVEARDQLRNWQPPITGEIIMNTFNLKPGPIVGKIKNAVREAILDGVIPNDYNAAYQFMKTEADKILKAADSQ